VTGAVSNTALTGTIPRGIREAGSVLMALAALTPSGRLRMPEDL